MVEEYVDLPDPPKIAPDKIVTGQLLYVYDPQENRCSEVKAVQDQGERGQRQILVGDQNLEHAYIVYFGVKLSKPYLILRPSFVDYVFGVKDRWDLVEKDCPAADTAAAAVADIAARDASAAGAVRVVTVAGAVVRAAAAAAAAAAGGPLVVDEYERVADGLNAKVALEPEKTKRPLPARAESKGKKRAKTQHKSHQGFVKAQALATKLLPQEADPELVKKLGDLLARQNLVNAQVRAAATVGKGRLDLERHCLDLEDLTRLTHEVLALAFVK